MFFDQRQIHTFTCFFYFEKQTKCIEKHTFSHVFLVLKVSIFNTVDFETFQKIFMSTFLNLIVFRPTMSRKISSETEMTISCSCNENHSLLREPCRCTSRVSMSDTRQKSFSKSRTNTVDFKEQNGTEF